MHSDLVFIKLIRYTEIEAVNRFNHHRAAKSLICSITVNRKIFFSRLIHSRLQYPSLQVEQFISIFGQVMTYARPKWTDMTLVCHGYLLFVLLRIECGEKDFFLLKSLNKHDKLQTYQMLNQTGTHTCTRFSLPKKEKCVATNNVYHFHIVHGNGKNNEGNKNTHMFHS